LIVAELYLGRPVSDRPSLALLPLPVSRALQLAFEESNQENDVLSEWLQDRALFPAHFLPTWTFLSHVRLATDPCGAFSKAFPGVFAGMEGTRKQVRFCCGVVISSYVAREPSTSNVSCPSLGVGSRLSGV
jgi:hypothetical protein